MTIVRRTMLLLPLALAFAAGCRDQLPTGPQTAPGAVGPPQLLVAPIGAVAQFEAGKFHNCAVLSDGSLICWGDNPFGQTNVPADLGPVTQVSAAVHTCAIKQDATLACWGYNTFGQTDVPANLGTVTQVSTNDYNTCAIRSDATLACWGANDLGQADVPADLGPVSQVSAGGLHTCAVKTDATVVCWGEFFASNVPADLGPVSQVSSGMYHTCAVKIDGSVTCWGDNGQLQTNVPAGLGPVTQIDAGSFHTCAVKTDASVACWGFNSLGLPTVPAGLGPVARVSLGEVHSCAMKTDNTVTCWGDNSYGQASLPGNIDPIASFSASPASVLAGQTYTLTLSNAQVPGHPEATAFTYAFDCGDGNGYGAAGPGNTALCTAGPSGTRTARGKVIDQDGDQREYTASVQVVLPQGVSFSTNFDSGASPLLEVLGPVAPSYLSGAAVFTAPFDSERTYLRTHGEYHGTDFVAEVTVTVVGSLGHGAAFFGFGRGETSSCEFACEPVGSPAIFARIHPDDFDGGGTRILNRTSFFIQQIGATGSGGFGTHRVRMSWTAATRQLTFAIDTDYQSGQPFAADATLGPFTAGAGVFDATNARIFFGGAANAAFDDLVVTVESADATAPVITPNVSGTQGNNGWYTSDVTVSWSVEDEESDITSSTGCAPTTVSTDTDAITLTCEASSAGGTNTQTVTIRRDATPPTLSPGVSPSPVLLNGSATAAAGANDALSGVAAQSCGALDTNTVGTRTVNCTATDNAGNTADAMTSYQVTYAFSGFSAPINDASGVLNVARAGQTIPLKWRLLDAAGAPITDLSGVTVTVAGRSCDAGSSAAQVEEYAPGGSGLQNLGDGYYQYNWKTPRSYSGSCKTMQLDLSEGSYRTALFSFTR